VAVDSNTRASGLSTERGNSIVVQGVLDLNSEHYRWLHFRNYESKKGSGRGERSFEMAHVAVVVWIRHCP
jgi:hypothetical protein